jgi:hypothetical protein
MSSRLAIITLTHQTIPVILDSSSQPNQRPFKKQSFTSLIQRTALTIWRIGAGKMASCVQPGVQRRSVFWRLGASGSARLAIPKLSSPSRSGRSLKTLLSVWISGFWLCGKWLTARMAFLRGRFTVLLASAKRLHGSCFSAFGWLPDCL